MYDEICIGNPYFIQTIELLKYLDKLKNMRSGEIKKKLTDGSLTLPKLILYPNRSISNQKYTKESIDEICKKTMLLILTHAGYHKVDRECFNILVDLLESHLKNLTTLLRKKLDQELIVGESASSSYHKLFPSSDRELIILGKVFNELGLSFSTFQKFNYGLILYRDHVLNQIDDFKIDLNLPIHKES